MEFNRCSFETFLEILCSFCIKDLQNSFVGKYEVRTEGVREFLILMLKYNNILNFSGDIILYDSEQYELFTLTFASKVLESFARVSGKIDAMDFGKSLEMSHSKFKDKMKGRTLSFNVASNIFLLLNTADSPCWWVCTPWICLFMEEVLWKLSRQHTVGSLLTVLVCTCGDTQISTEETASASFCHSVTIWVLYDMQCTSALPFTHFGTNLWPCIFYLFLKGVIFVMMKILRIQTKAK